MRAGAKQQSVSAPEVPAQQLAGESPSNTRRGDSTAPATARRTPQPRFPLLELKKKNEVADEERKGHFNKLPGSTSCPLQWPPLQHPFSGFYCFLLFL